MVVGRHSDYLRVIDGHRAEDALPDAIADLPPGSTLLDVGANIGVVTLSMAALRPDCHVIAFEPVPSNLECLRENVAASGLGNIEVVAAAVSNETGSVRVEDNGPWSVAGVEGGVLCPSSYLDEFDSPTVAFVKIDVEGFEPNVLAGAKRILARGPLVLMEFNPWAMLLHHYDPLVFAEALWANSDILGVKSVNVEVAIPENPTLLLHDIMIHYRYADVLLRPRSPLPDFAAMTEAPAAAQLRRENAALRASTSWRLTAPLRALKQTMRRR